MADNTFYTNEMKGSHHWKQPCYLCNEWILNDENISLVFMPLEYSRQYKLNNIIVHTEEWQKFVEGLTPDEIILKLVNLKKPKRKPLTEEQLRKAESFKKACSSFGFNIVTISQDKRFVKCRQRKSSFTIVFDIVHEKISCTSKVRCKGLFDGLFEGEFVAKVCNKYYEFEKIDKHEDFTVEKVLNKVIEETNKMLK